MEFGQEKGNFSGAMVSTTQGSGKMVRKMAVDIGNPLKDRVIWGSGKMGKLQATESIQ